MGPQWKPSVIETALHSARGQLWADTAELVASSSPAIYIMSQASHLSCILILLIEVIAKHKIRCFINVC